MVSAYYFLGSKQKFGRGVGIPVTETDEFLWNQDNAFTDGGLPGGLSKIQVDHTFSPNFFVSAKAAYYDTGFGLAPRGGDAQTYTLDYVNSEAIGSYQDSRRSARRRSSTWTAATSSRRRGATTS